MRRAGWTAALTLAAALALPAAAEAAASWRVLGSIAGTYDNSTVWEQCFDTGATGTASEHVDLDVRLRPAATSRYRRGVLDFAAIAYVEVGGRWTVTGSYAPRQRDARGTATCGGPTPIACSGNVTNRRASERRPVPVAFQRKGRMFVGNFTNFVEISEDTSGQPAVCDPDAHDDSLAMRLLLGLNDAAGSLFTGHYRFPMSRLNGRRSFTITPTPNPKDGDPCSQLYLSCSQNNQLTMQLTFTPAR